MPKANYTPRGTKNRVNLIGKLETLDVKELTSEKGKALSVNGSVAVTPQCKLKFSAYIPSLKKDGEVRKDYLQWKEYIASAKSIHSVGVDNADMVSISGRIASNVYVNRNGQLIQGTKIQAEFISRATEQSQPKAEVDFTGYIHDVKKEDMGLRVKVFGLNYNDDAVPFSFYVPEGLVDDFEDSYSEGQTSTFCITVVTKTIAENKRSGGIGVQRTSGRTRIEYQLEGAEPPYDDGDRDAIDSLVMREALAKRKAYLKSVEEAGYQGNRRSSNQPSRRGGISGFAGFNDDADDEDF